MKKFLLKHGPFLLFFTGAIGLGCSVNVTSVLGYILSFTAIAVSAMLLGIIKGLKRGFTDGWDRGHAAALEETKKVLDSDAWATEIAREVTKKIKEETGLDVDYKIEKVSESEFKNTVTPKTTPATPTLSKQEILDKILDKISATGFDKLTEEEKEFLKSNSNKI